MAKLMSKSELVQKIAEQHANNMTRKDVKGVIETLAEIGHKELKKTGAFFVPGFAKLIVITDEKPPRLCLHYTKPPPQQSDLAVVAQGRPARWRDRQADLGHGGWPDRRGRSRHRAA